MKLPGLFKKIRQSLAAREALVNDHAEEVQDMVNGCNTAIMMRKIEPVDRAAAIEQAKSSICPKKAHG